MSNKDLTLQERISVLEDLHRPLEEHWAVRAKGLDARNSDFIYKHHVTRLEDIYANQKFEVKEPPQMFVMSPVSQLYGVNGIKTNIPGKKEKKKQREDKWVDNFQKYNHLKDSAEKDKEKTREKDKTEKDKDNSGKPPKKSLRPASAPGGTRGDSHSPSRGARTSHNTLPRHREETDYEDDEGEREPGYVKKRNHGKQLSKQDLIMLGLYRLNAEQEDIYNKFVKMISEFDAFDMENIVLDAMHDAQSDDLLGDYGGTDCTDY